MTREYRVNDQIKDKQVSLVLPDGSMKGEVPFSEALLIAEEENLDLVEISTSKGGVPPVCRIMDYGKMMYQQSKKKKQNKQAQHTKEIKYGFNIDDHDLAVKHNKVKEFLSKHYTVRYILELRGREKYMTDAGMKKITENLNHFDTIATWKSPQISGGGKKVEISTTLHANSC